MAIVWKCGLEVVDEYDGKEGIFKDQHTPMPMILHVLMQTKIFLILCISMAFADVDSCGGNTFFMPQTRIATKQYTRGQTIDRVEVNDE